MKEKYRKPVALALFVLALAGASLTQDFSPKVRANIPVSFFAGGKTSPAGNYTLAVRRSSNHVAILQKDTGIGTFLIGSPHDGSRSGLSLLTFRGNREGTYVLQKIEGPDHGVSFVPDKALLRMALNGSKNSREIVIAAVGNWLRFAAQLEM